MDWLKWQSDFSKRSVLVDRKINNMFVLLASLGDTTSDVGPNVTGIEDGPHSALPKEKKKHALSRKGFFLILFEVCVVGFVLGI